MTPQERGRLGGRATFERHGREHMAKIGRRGGEARGAARGRGAGVSNSGGVPESGGSGYQNSRAGQADREVELDNRGDTSRGRRPTAHSSGETAPGTR